MKKKTIIIIAVIALLGTILIASSGGSNTQENENPSSSAVVQEEDDRYTTLSGMENGELVVEEINVWENVGPDRGKVVGKISHDTKVKILEEKTNDQLYYKIQSPEGLTGWVSEQFVTEVTE